MTDLVWALGATAAWMAVMYLVCLRPMRRGRRASAANPPDDTQACDELARLRHEVAALRDRAATR